MLKIKVYEENFKVYVVTRCEEHCDYVEKVFLTKSEAKDYCKRFNSDEDEYHRHITEVELTI